MVETLPALPLNLEEIGARAGRARSHLAQRRDRVVMELDSLQNRILTIDTGTVYRAPGQAGPGNDINAGSPGSQKAPTCALPAWLPSGQARAEPLRDDPFGSALSRLATLFLEQ
jgi:hypothetical protein